MTRDEFKAHMSTLIDSIITEDRELDDADEDSLQDQLGDVAVDILAQDNDGPDTPDEPSPVDAQG